MGPLNIDTCPPTLHTTSFQMAHNVAVCSVGKNGPVPFGYNRNPKKRILNSRLAKVLVYMVYLMFEWSTNKNFGLRVLNF